jgi:hypothetical protein
MRNFSLLLNVHDMDGPGVDATSAGQDDTEALSNIEGMRQVALGMNLLAQAIKKHGNVYVVVVSEGGRGSNGGDNKASHALIMGPGGQGNLRDHLYANAPAIAPFMHPNLGLISNDPFCADPNEGGATAIDSPGLTTLGAGLRPYSGGDLRSDGGLALSATIPNVACVLNGLVKHLEENQGRSTTLSGLGPYVRLAKKA